MVGIILLVAFLIIIFLGAPISLSMGLAAGIGMYVGNYNLEQIVILFQKGISNYTLIAIPYYVLAANIMNTGGITSRIFNFAESLVGWMHGGLAQVNVLASVIFAGISGTSSADAAGLGIIEINAMKEKGYDLSWSTAITLASSLLGPIIPPSVAFITYAIYAEVSATEVFIAGIVPGVVMTIVLMVMNHFVAKSGKFACPTPTKFSFTYTLKTFREGFFALLAPVVLLVCIFSGAVTATEAGVIAVFYSLFAAAMYKELTFDNVKKALYSTVISTAVIMFLIGFGSTIGWVLAIERVPQMVTKAMMSLTSNKYLLLLLINIMLLVMGMFIDSTTIRIITVPLFLPLIDLLGISRIQFGVIHTLNCLIGTCTPPVGVGLMIMTTITGQKFTDVVKSFMIYYIPLLIALLIITYVPFVSLWLPGLLK